MTRVDSLTSSKGSRVVQSKHFCGYDACLGSHHHVEESLDRNSYCEYAVERAASARSQLTLTMRMAVLRGMYVFPSDSTFVSGLVVGVNPISFLSVG